MKIWQVTPPSCRKSVTGPFSTFLPLLHWEDTDWGVCEASVQCHESEPACPASPRTLCRFIWLTHDITALTNRLV